MKKSVRAIGLGLAGITTTTAILNAGSVLEVSAFATNFKSITKDGCETSLSINNDNKSKFWYHSCISNDIIARAGSYFKFSVKNTKKALSSIKLVKDKKALFTSNEGESFLRVDVSDLNGFSIGDLSVKYTFKDKTSIIVNLAEYFTKGETLEKIILDTSKPKMDFISSEFLGDNDGEYFKGKIEYNFQSEGFNKLESNSFGGNGYLYELYVNGVRYHKQDGLYTVEHDDITGKLKFIVDFDKFPVKFNGKVKLSLRVRNYVGNASIYNSYVYPDYSSPEISANILSPYYQKDGVTYFSEGSNVEVGYSSFDEVSNINKVYLIKDGNKTELEGMAGSFLLEKGVTYRLGVEDSVGNYTEHSLNELCGISDEIKYVKGKPLISVEENNIKDNWFNGNSNIKFSATDSLGIKTVSYTVNGLETIESSDSGEKEYTKVFDKSFCDDSGSLNIHFKVTNVLGKVNEYDVNYNTDIVSPKLNNFSYDGELVDINGKSYSKSAITLNGDIVDEGSGVSKIEVLRDNEVVSDTLPYIIDTEGVYKIKIYDVAGNITEKTVQELIGLENQTIVIDNTKPSISATINDGIVSERKWYRDKANLKLSISDTKYLKSIVYSINGEKTELNFDTWVDSKDISLDLEDKIDSNGIVDFTCEVEDYLGLKSVYSKKIKVDTKVPEIDNISFTSEVFEYGDIAYIKGEGVLNADIIDSDSGIKYIEVYKDSDIIATSLPVNISENGKYIIKIVDNSGRVVRKTLSELLGKSFKSVVVDKDTPSINISVNSSEPLESWYKDTANLVLNCSDAKLKNITYSINGNKVMESVGKDSYSLVKNLEEYTDSRGIVDFEFSAEDYVGNVTTVRRVFKIDKDNPTIDNPTVSGNFFFLGNTMYIKGDVNLKCNVSDGHSGILKATLLRNGIPVVNKSKVSDFESDGAFNVVSQVFDFTLNRSGMYVVEVVDNAGHITTKTLGEILGKGEIEKVGVDSYAPKVSFTINNGEPLDTWYKDKAMAKIFTKDNTSVKDITYSINGSDLNRIGVNDVKYLLRLNLEKYVDENGKVNIDYNSYDNLGNVTNINKDIRIDCFAPSISDGTLSGSYVQDKGTVYAKDSLVLNATVEDKESGVQGVEIYKDDILVGTELPFTIKDSGSYSIKVSDNVGHTTVKSLKDLVGFDNIIIDNRCPIIDATIDGESIKDSWYREKAILHFGISDDDSPISKVTCKVNGRDVDIEDLYSINLDLVDYIDDKGLVELELKAYDIVGNVSNYSRVIKLDTVKPSITKCSLSNIVKTVDGISYSNKDMVLDVSTADKESGVQKVEILKDGEVVSSEVPYLITESGSYSVRVTDNVGYVVEESLGKLLGTDIDSIVIDSDNPTLLRQSGFTPDIVKGVTRWYKHTPSLVYRVDEDNIDNVLIKVNGEKVYNGVNESNEYPINIEDIEGNYKIEISVKDKASNISTDEFEFSVDHSKPVITNGVIVGDYVARDYGLYFNTKPTVELSSKDLGIGVKEYIIKNNETGKELSNSDGVFTLGTGDYYVKVRDFFGIESDWKSLEEICNLKNNRIVIDKESPSIVVEKDNQGLEGYYKGDVGYKISLSDNIGVHSAEISINNIKVGSYLSDSENPSVVLNTNTNKVYTEDGKYTVNIVVEDCAGHISNWSETINIDTSAPELVSSKIDGRYVYKDKVIFNEPPRLFVESKDLGIGIKSMYLISEDGDTKVDIENGTCLLQNGSYYLVMEDYLGNITKPTPLSEICNLPSNYICIDSKNPELDVKRSAIGVNNWYADDISYIVDTSDEVGLDKIVININGVENITNCDGSLSCVVNPSTSCAEPNSDGSYNVSIRAYDLIGNVSEWSDTIYIDSIAPKIEKFNIYGDVYSKGLDINGSGKYGYFINGDVNVEVVVSDGDYTSGMDKVYYKLIKSDGSNISKVADIVNGVAKLDVDKGFKGFIEAYATDKVGNVGSVNKPDGIVTEGGNTHLNTSYIGITTPNTSYTDKKGYPLYNQGVTLEAVIKDSVSGLSKVSWGINDEVKGESLIDLDGVVSGSGVILGKDNNLVVSLSNNCYVGDNLNDITVWVESVDRVGNISKNSRVISIDKDAPIVNVSYDINNSNNMYNSNRVAKVSIKERNFDSSNVKFSGNYGSIGSWVYVGNDTWESSVVFSTDDDYQWSVTCSDKAGNYSNTYSSERFTIDKTNPTMTVVFDNNNAENSNFYKSSRVATITVNEKNFDSSLVTLSGNGTLGNWSSNGNTHTCNIVFSEDGEYDFNLSLKDKAGNTGNSFSSGKFTIDKSTPLLEVKGVQDGVSYKKNMNFSISLGDKYIDPSRCKVSLVGRSLGEVKLVGGLNGTSGEYTFSGVPDDEKYDDLYTLYVEAYDLAGNYVDKKIIFSINRYGSKYKFLESSLLGNITNKAKDVELEEMSVDRLDLRNCKIEVIKDGQSIDVDKSLIDIVETGGTTSNWVYTYKVKGAVFNTDGKYQIQVYSKSLDGSENSSLRQEYAFMLDSTPPEVVIAGVEDNGVYNEVSKKITIDVRDLSGVSSIKARLNGQYIDLSESNGVYTFDVKESNSRQDLELEVVDKANNVTTAKVSSFLITSNAFMTIINNPLFKWFVGGIVTLVMALVGVLFYKRKKSRLAEVKLAEEHAKLYKESTTNSSTNNTTKK